MKMHILVVTVLVALGVLAWCAPTHERTRRKEPNSKRSGPNAERDRSTAHDRGFVESKNRSIQRAIHVEIDNVSALELVEAALGSGASLPRALEVVGRVSAGEFGGAMVSVAGALALGSSWSQAWAMVGKHGHGLDKILEPAWSGASARPLVARAANQARRSRSTRAAELAQQLGVVLVLPLGLCFLPAFILITVLPVLISFSAGML